jgi:hypothetical protein
MVRKVKENKVKCLTLSEFHKALKNRLVIAKRDFRKGEEIGYIISNCFYYYTSDLKVKKER